MMKTIMKSTFNSNLIEYLYLHTYNQCLDQKYTKIQNIITVLKRKIQISIDIDNFEDYIDFTLSI